MATLAQVFPSSTSEFSSVYSSRFCPRKAASIRHVQVKQPGNSVLQSKRGLQVCCFAQKEPRTEDVAANFPSLYRLLGLDQSVELPEIKSAYRQMARKYHPDVCPAEDREMCTKLFLQVQDAYETLSDPSRRADYDFSLMQSLSGTARGWDFAVGQRRRGTGVDAATESWKSQWESQLEVLRSREEDQMSWGARMRAKHRQT